MVRSSKFTKQSGGRGWNRGSKSRERRGRLTCFETLESRNLLSITLPTISAQTLLSGTGLNLVLNGTSSAGNALTYTVAVSNSNLTNSGTLTAAVTSGNPSLQLTVADTADSLSGNLKFQLFKDLAPETVDKIMTLVNSGYYDGVSFHRIIEDFMIQGGKGATLDSKFDDEFNSLLQFTSPGLLAMANSGNDSNSSQFFITTAKTRWLDFNYNIFGILTEGSSLLNSLDSVDVVDTTDYVPVNDVIITDASMVTDTQNGVLRLSVANGVTGSATVTVTATDSVTGETKTQTFALTVSADTTNDPPYLDDIDSIVTTADTAVTFTIPGIDVEGDTMTYKAVKITDTDAVTLTLNETTGAVTITPATGACGVVIIEVGVSDSAGTNWDTQYIPVCITPYSPLSVTLVSDYDTGASKTDNVTSLNNSSASKLQFKVTGVTSGMTVKLYSDGVLIGSTTATDTTATITTNGTTTLADGTHTITATQTLEDQTINCNNLQSVADLESPKNTTMTLTVAAADPEFDFTPVTTAVAGVAYSCQVALAADASDDLTYTYSLAGALSGMSINSTGLITWTPTTSQVATHNVIVNVTDSAGNTATTTYALTVLAANAAPVIATPASPSLGSTNEDTAINISLTSFINHGADSTIITDDTNGVLGGVALVGLTGEGTWKYSLDGTTFTAVGTVSESSALLLPSDAMLRYTPAGDVGESATIKYHAWDTTSGAEATKVNLSGVNATGGQTAYSANSDTATLTVTALNDAPVLTQNTPPMGTTNAETPITIVLSAFINNGDGTTQITDADDGALFGIALTGHTGEGTWTYSTDGTTYTDVGTVSTTAALLLPLTAKLRYTPDAETADTGETATIVYRAWDATSGTAGTKADTTTTGGTSAFSAVSDTGSLTVTSLVSTSCGISGYVYVDADNDGARITANDKTHMAIQGATVTLYIQASSAWTKVSSTTTNATGAYSFTELAAGTYKIVEAQPTRFIDGKDTAGAVGGAKRGTVGSDQHILTLAAGESGTEYNFGERGVKAGHISLRSTLASAVTASSSEAGEDTSPTVDLAKSVTGTGYSATYTAGGSAVKIAASNATIADADSENLVSMTVTIANRQNSTSEILSATTTGTGLTASYADGVLTITGSAAPSVYQQVLRTIKYSNTATSPTAGARTINVVVNDGFSNSTAAVCTLTVKVTASPTVDLAASVTGTSYSATYTVGGSAVAIAAANATVADTDSTKLASMTVTITNRKNGSSEILSATTTGTGLTSSYASGVLTITGSATPAIYQQVLRTIKYSNTATSPTVGARTINVVVNDGYSNSTAAVCTLTVATTNAPTVDLAANVTGTGYSATYTVGGSAVAIAAADATVADTDSANLTSMTVTIANRQDGSSETLAATTTDTGLTASYSNGVLTITGSATAAIYQQVLRTIKYSNTATTPTVGTRTINVVANDGASSSTAAVCTLTVTATGSPTVDLAASVTGTGYSATYTVGGSAVAIAAADATVADTDSANLTSMTVTIANRQDGSSETLSATTTGTGLTSSYSSGVLTITGSATPAIYQQVLRTIKYSNTATTPTVGTRTINVAVSDGTSKSAAAVCTLTVAAADATAPSGYSITANSSLIKTSTQTALGFTFAGAEVGATYSYTVISNGGSGSVTGSGTVTSATQQVTGINVSALPDGVLTISAKLTDTAGNVGSPVAATTVLDRTAPTGYSIAMADGSISTNTEAAATSFTFTGAEILSTYTYTVTSSGGSGSVTGSGTVTSTTQAVTGINVSALPDGTLTYSVTLTDLAGNVGTAVTTTAKLDRVAPAGYTVAFGGSSYNDATDSSVSFAISNAEAFTTYSYTITSSGGAGSITKTGSLTLASYTFSGIDASALADGTLTVSITLTDAVGNVGAAATATTTLARETVAADAALAATEDWI